MKFKVGDKVRLTREVISYKLRESMNIKYSIVLGSAVDDVSADRMYLVNYIRYSEHELELVPEKPEFEYGEVVEVTNGIGEWTKAIFIMALPNAVKYPFVCVKDGDKNSFHNGFTFLTSNWKYARKLQPNPPQLTRKEIAEEFGVNENFILVD